jgi:hypothetical protein
LTGDNTKTNFTSAENNNVMKSFFFLLMATFCSISSFAQNVDSTDWRFHDELLDHLVGKWRVTGTAFGKPTKETLEAEWVIDHQYLHIHEKSEQNIPEIDGPFETEFFIGFNRNSKRYVVHEMNVCGTAMCEGFYYATRTGNEIKIEKTSNSLPASIQRFVWEPSSASWHIELRLVRDLDGKLVNNGKEGDVVIDLELVTAK